jgi:choline transport protein
MNHETYVPERWHVTLMMWAIFIMFTVTNIFARKILAPLEVLGGTFHIVLYPAFIGVLAYFGNHNSATFVFTEFHSFGGWKNSGVVFSLGTLCGSFAATAFDGILHMGKQDIESFRTGG